MEIELGLGLGLEPAASACSDWAMSTIDRVPYSQSPCTVRRKASGCRAVILIHVSAVCDSVTVSGDGMVSVGSDDGLEVGCVWWCAVVDHANALGIAPRIALGSTHRGVEDATTAVAA